MSRTYLRGKHLPPRPLPEPPARRVLHAVVVWASFAASAVLLAWSVYMWLGGAL